MPSNKPSTVTTVQNSSPWSGVQDSLKFGFDQARQNYDSSSPSYFPNSTVVPFSNQTETGLSGIENRAMQGSALNQGAKDLTQSTLNGDFLSAGNPYFQNMTGN